MTRVGHNSPSDDGRSLLELRALLLDLVGESALCYPQMSPARHQHCAEGRLSTGRLRQVLSSGRSNLKRECKESVADRSGSSSLTLFKLRLTISAGHRLATAFKFEQPS
ncbi:uncharacterized protein HMPREF1120_06918 [Exophiala dermatitidis NIH/UT8656]|uniref:Uncharacterized protein n=1 Tax=Exophiala dermatitidis (strain ATCC 34100 / CBS 525.76 / NIH/UT8656) TaxID=858893 RepID=H6C515_EXODN|nr:uncharacterized protein HMPREF1120_06918 [Exophiala dermatitidis NIH/UT8656]EHY58916.1 hypothetical protein HMPREF1120_06918 [Exophiala dermatitidis NIH/UT8656]